MPNEATLYPVHRDAFRTYRKRQSPVRAYRLLAIRQCRSGRVPFYLGSLCRRGHATRLAANRSWRYARNGVCVACAAHYRKAHVCPTPRR